MKKILKWLSIGFLLGLAAGFMAGILVFPYLFPPPPVNEVVENKEQKEVLATAEFIHVNPDDPIHYGKGRATLYGDLLHLEADFEVGPGPKYHVYLVPEAEITADSKVGEMMFVDLGRLKAFSGSQNYLIPPGINLEKYQSVVIWCEQFNVLISTARIELSNGKETAEPATDNSITPGD